jgi:hypothetical protein
MLSWILLKLMITFLLTNFNKKKESKLVKKSKIKRIFFIIKYLIVDLV